jgi:hypothetical protein
MKGMDLPTVSQVLLSFEVGLAQQFPHLLHHQYHPLRQALHHPHHPHLQSGLFSEFLFTKSEPCITTSILT